MNLEITVRHITPKDAVKDTVKDSLKAAAEARIRELADKLAADFPAIENIHAVVDVEGNDVTTSLSVQGGQATTIDASAKDPDAAACVNALFDKAVSQLRRASEKRQSTRG